MELGICDVAIGIMRPLQYCCSLVPFPGPPARRVDIRDTFSYCGSSIIADRPVCAPGIRLSLHWTAEVGVAAQEALSFRPQKV